MSGPRRFGSHNRPAGFTIVEVLVVIGVIVVLAGILLPALVGVRKTGLMTESMSNMKQISTWMRLYSTDNRDHILPSQFNYSENPNKGKVRSTQVATGDMHKGTWADILWTINEIGVFPDAGNPAALDYRFDSPDRALYDTMNGVININVLRSAANNSRPTPGSPVGEFPRPFGQGGDNTGEAGYFAANNFFNSDEESPTYNGWFTNGQIKAPDRSMYLVDSVAGETIEDDEGIDIVGHRPFDNSESNPNLGTLEVDFRYPGDVCLMLFLDGHIDPVGEWDDLEHLQDGMQIRVRHLTKPPGYGP